MFTLACAALPGGRGMGEPVRLMIDLPNEAQMLALFVHVPGGRLIVASEAGDGFVLPEDEAVAQTRAGRQVLNLKEGVRAAVCRPVHGRPCGGDRQQPQASRLSARRAAGDGPRQGRAAAALQGQRGQLGDAITFDLADGLSWKDPAGRTRTVAGGGAGRVGRRARQRRADGAARLPAGEPVRLRGGHLHDTGVQPQSMSTAPKEGSGPTRPGSCPGTGISGCERMVVGLR